ncbi:TerD family protein [Acinetobacter puyangensis]|uniref:TerD family protein n=1 Tax=Acinetobacter puyangensis TaxID=1096779 RepID=UPI003A4DE9E7
MTELIAGANLTLNDPSLHLRIYTQHKQQSIQPDFAAYLLAEQTSKVRSDADMVFYGQTQSGNGSVKLTQQGNPQTFVLELNQIEQSVAKVAISASLDSPHTFNEIDHVKVELLSKGQVIATAQISGQERSEAALIIGEFYRRQAQWKFRLVAQGFNGGLKPLSEYFGVEIKDEPAPAPVSNPIPASPPSQSKINLSKVTLDKQNNKINLSKKASGFGEIKINLNWNKQNTTAQQGGFFKKLLNQNQGVDLDLGCLFEMRDGTKSVVQALGNCFGDFNRFPFIQLSADDRTGALSDGEWLRINGQHWQDIRRVVIFAFIYQGVPNWSATDGVVTIYVPDQPPIEIRLTEGQPLGMCGIVELTNQDGSIQVQRHVRYVKGHIELDDAFGFGLRWKAGSK